MKSLSFMLMGRPAALYDVFWIKNHGFDITAVINPKVEREARHYGELSIHYECDALTAEFLFKGWKRQISIVKYYENDFRPTSVFSYNPHPEKILENANRRLSVDIARIKEKGIKILEERLFTQEMLTRERADCSKQEIYSLFEAIKKRQAGEKIQASAETFISKKADRTGESRIASAKFTFLSPSGKSAVMRDYFMNSNCQYSDSESADIANARLERDIKRLKDADIPVKYSPFSEDSF